MKHSSALRVGDICIFLFWIFQRGRRCRYYFILTFASLPLSPLLSLTLLSGWKENQRWGREKYECCCVSVLYARIIHPPTLMKLSPATARIRGAEHKAWSNLPDGGPASITHFTADRERERDGNVIREMEWERRGWVEVKRWRLKGTSLVQTCRGDTSEPGLPVRDKFLVSWLDLKWVPHRSWFASSPTPQTFCSNMICQMSHKHTKWFKQLLL